MSEDHPRRRWAYTTVGIEHAFKARDEGYDDGHRHGFVEGQADVLVSVLRARGIEVSEEDERRIRKCNVPSTFTYWARRVVTADNAGDMFGESF